MGGRHIDWGMFSIVPRKTFRNYSVNCLTKWQVVKLRKIKCKARSLPNKQTKPLRDTLPGEKRKPDRQGQTTQQAWAAFSQYDKSDRRQGQPSAPPRHKLIWRSSADLRRTFPGAQETRTRESSPKIQTGKMAHNLLSVSPHEYDHDNGHQTLRRDPITISDDNNQSYIGYKFTVFRRRVKWRKPDQTSMRADCVRANWLSVWFQLLTQRKKICVACVKTHHLFWVEQARVVSPELKPKCLAGLRVSLLKVHIERILLVLASNNNDFSLNHPSTPRPTLLRGH